MKSVYVVVVSLLLFQNTHVWYYSPKCCLKILMYDVVVVLGDVLIYIIEVIVCVVYKIFMYDIVVLNEWERRRVGCCKWKNIVL